MKAKLITTKGHGLQTQVEVEGVTLNVINELEANDFVSGSMIDIEIYDAVYFEELSDNSVTANPNKKKELIHLNECSYQAFGEVTSVGPAICDCGVIELDIPVLELDESYLGTFISFKVDVLSVEEVFIPSNLDYAIEAYQEKDYSEAYKLLVPLANEGESIAQRYLARLYYHGRVVDKDLEISASWFEKSAINGDMISQRFLAWLYAEGKGVSQSNAKSRMWYQSAANLGSERAMANLGWIYFKGIGVSPNYGKALSYFQEASDLDDSWGTCMLGIFYEYGYVVKQNFVKAAELYTASKELGDLQGQYNLGLAYYFGRGVEKDKQQALTLIEDSASKQNPDAIHFLSLNP